MSNANLIMEKDCSFDPAEEFCSRCGQCDCICEEEREGE